MEGPMEEHRANLALQWEFLDDEWNIEVAKFRNQRRFAFLSEA